MLAFTGVFFQGGVFFQIDPAAAAVRVHLDVLYTYTFHGGVAGAEGECLDKFGQATVTNFVMTDDKVTFIKRYLNRNDSIHYTLKKNGNIWEGSYSGVLTGRGACKMVITEVPDDFLVQTVDLDPSA